MNAENNFVRLARAYEILSDDKLTRRRYDCLLQDGIMEYPDDMHYDWDYIDQKLGLKGKNWDEKEAFWARGGHGSDRRSAYEDAKKFYEAEKKWSWETDTTLQDMRDNPLVLVLMLGAAVLFFMPRQTIEKVTKMTLKAAEKQKRVDTIQRKVEKTTFTQSGNDKKEGGSKGNRNRKDMLEKQKRDMEAVVEEEKAEEAEKLELARSDVTVLLQTHIEDLILIFSPRSHSSSTKNSSPANSMCKVDAESIDWGSIGDEYDISNGDILYVCDQIRDLDLLNRYADCLVAAFPGDDHSEDSDNDCNNDGDTCNINRDTIDDFRTDLHRILQHVIQVLQERQRHQQKMAAAHMKTKIKSSSKNKILTNRVWDATTISCLAKGVNKYQSHRKRWDLVADYMNHILSPMEPFTKPECIQQAQHIQQIQSGQNMQKKQQQEGIPPAFSTVDARTPLSSCTAATILKAEGEGLSTKDSTRAPVVAINTSSSSTVSTAWSVEQQKQLGKYTIYF